MDPNSTHIRTARKPSASQSSPPSPRKQVHKRQRSKTVGTTFVSTAVVPAPSSTDVLSSLISSLTLLSDSAREQIRSAREHDPNASSLSLEPTYTNVLSTSDGYNHLGASPTHHIVENVGGEDDDEAEPPAVGYLKPRSKDPARPSLKDKWASHGLGKEKSINLGRSGSSHTLRRPPSAASSGIGVPSIERGHSGSSGSLPMLSATRPKSPLKMFLPPRQDDDSIHSALNSPRDPELKSVKSFKTSRSKQSATVYNEQEKEPPVTDLNVNADDQLRVSPAQPLEKFTSEHKTYSPLSPSNREDLGEHLIPSRRSSMRHSPSLRGSSKGRSSSAGRASSLHSRSFPQIAPETPRLEVSEEPVGEEGSTLRRIKELQQAKEKRQMEWRKESKRSERTSVRLSRKHSKSSVDGFRDRSDGTGLKSSEDVESAVPKHLQSNEKIDRSSASTPVIREIDVPSPVPSGLSAIPSPALSTPRKHKRSLSAGLRRSGSMKQRPMDDLRTVSEQVEAFLTAPRLTQRIRHPLTGRTIAFSEAGDPNGFAVFCCVGMGLTRYVTSFYDDVARTQRLRLITPDRPGIGESSPLPDNVCTPLAWVDDIEIICQTLNIETFSLLAHSAGSIYALATALKMPDRVCGRIHLLAPWIPPSQFSNSSGSGESRSANLPMAHKLLSVLPAPFLRAANSRFLSATSASIDPRVGRNRKKDQSIAATYDTLLAEMAADVQSVSTMAPDTASARHSSLSYYAPRSATTPPPYGFQNGMISPPMSPSPSGMKRHYSSPSTKLRSPTPVDVSWALSPQTRQALFNSELTHRTWALATLNANPAADLLVCLERRRTIGFRYTDVTRGVVIHHGRNDARVPLDNVQWLSGAMKSCELRILSDEGHGLMASATVMSRVLGEIGREWEELDIVAKDNSRRRREQELETEKIKEAGRRRFIREGY